MVRGLRTPWPQLSTPRSIVDGQVTGCQSTRRGCVRASRKSLQAHDRRAAGPVAANRQCPWPCAVVGAEVGLSDLFESEDLARFDRELTPLAHAPSKLVHDPASGEVQCLSPAAAEVLERCDGSRILAEVVEIFPATVRAEAERCVQEIARAGLLV